MNESLWGLAKTQVSIIQKYRNLTTQSSNTHQTASIRTNLQARECKARQIGNVAMLIIAPLPEAVKPRKSRKSADLSKHADSKRVTPEGVYRVVLKRSIALCGGD